MALPVSFTEAGAVIPSPSCLSQQACLPWTPTTQKVSQTGPLHQLTPKFSPAPRLLSWIHVLFSFLADKNSPFYYGESVHLSVRRLPTPTYYFVPRVAHRLGEGLMWAKQG